MRLVAGADATSSTERGAFEPAVTELAPVEALAVADDDGAPRGRTLVGLHSLYLPSALRKRNMGAIPGNAAWWNTYSASPGMVYQVR